MNVSLIFLYNFLTLKHNQYKFSSIHYSLLVSDNSSFKKFGGLKAKVMIFWNVLVK